MAGITQAERQVRDPRESTRNVFDTLAAGERFGRFPAAARSAELEPALRGADLITVFAVPDSPLAGESEETLRAAAAQHIVKGCQTAADLRTTATVKTLEGAPVTVGFEGGQARFGDARVVHADIACTNGINQELESS